MEYKIFERSVIVEIGIKGKPAQRFKGFRVKFHVEQTPGAIPNKGKIEIYNLTRDSAAIADQKNSQVRLIAGYAGYEEVIYVGDISPKHSRTEMDDNGVSTVTRIECADGIDNYQNSFTEKSYAEGTPYSQILKEVAASLSTLGNPRLVDLPDQTVLGGFTASGQSLKTMNDLTKKLGLAWSIQDGVVEVVKKGGAVKDEAILLSPTTGLVGIPKRKDEGIELTSLLQPKMRPNRQIQLQSRLINGVYIAGKVTHQGDTHGQEFYTIVEAKKQA